jgi:hypothetical protein
MNHKDMIVIGIAATMLTATMTITDATIAFAEKDEDDSPPNTWGKAASDAGQDGEMGDHASNQDEPRSGIGNVARAFGGDHPSDLPGELCELDPDSDLCD